MNSAAIKTYLYWILVAQICLISISIAASSLLLALMMVSLAMFVFVERRWIFPRTTLEYAFLAYIIIEFITAINSEFPLDAFKNSKRLLLISLVYATFIALDAKEKYLRLLKIFSASVSILSLIEIYFYFSDGFEPSERAWLDGVIGQAFLYGG